MAKRMIPHIGTCCTEDKLTLLDRQVTAMSTQVTVVSTQFTVVLTQSRGVSTQSTGGVDTSAVSSNQSEQREESKKKISTTWMV